ncbi:hypothetical protein Nepgr_017239 [Nepenthes gracilis]|uniref:Uncharacterized protein n=1 Tax=Nepenthes gracilis TaxID=150966 RepID=A0AAD3SQ24_NEPGR|nr:hypothetical protein Nepgr_017239 [Nepenthes gracilis]
MKFSKDEKWNRFVRAIKTIFFLITLSFSFLVVSAPVFLAVADTLLPSALFSASLSPLFLSPQTISSHLNNYDFRYSLIDIPLISIIRSIVIICVYSLCDRPMLSRAPYLCVATMCSALSFVFISLKASFSATLRWRTELAAGNARSFLFTKLTLKLLRLALMDSPDMERCCKKRERRTNYNE